MGWILHVIFNKLMACYNSLLNWEKLNNCETQNRFTLVYLEVIPQDSDSLVPLSTRLINTVSLSI